MGQRPGIEGGLNTEVRDGAAVYHVQTQCSLRGAPVVESLVYAGGQVLIRMTVSCEVLARRYGFTADDGRRLLEAQHGDLLRKIRCGMLRDDDEPRPAAAGTDAAAGETEQPANLAAELAAVEDPQVRELLRELGAEIDLAGRPRPSAPRPPAGRDAPRPPTWLRRLASRLRRLRGLRGSRIREKD